LSNTLGEIKKKLAEPVSSSKRNHPKTPKTVERWEEFRTNAANFNFPTNLLSSDILLPVTTEIEFSSEKDVDKVIGVHLDNFNRILRDLNQIIRFRTKATANLPDGTTLTTLTPTNPVAKFIGVPDNILCNAEIVLSFIEDKTPTDLPVINSNNELLLDLLTMYKEDIIHKNSDLVRGSIGRNDVINVIEQVYGYIALNNLVYGCVTCYDVTYFLCRPKRGTLLISHPIYRDSTGPTLLQAIYYFVTLILDQSQTLGKSPTDVPVPVCLGQYDSETNEGDDNYKHKPSRSRPNSGKNFNYKIDMNSLKDGIVIGTGATGQVIYLKDSNTVLKQCYSYNNEWGSNMLKNEIIIYEKMSMLNLNCIPRYYGDCDLYGQQFIAMEFIDGICCDWRNSELYASKLFVALEELKRAGVQHNDLRPENVLLTKTGEVKVIDFGLAELCSLY
jgi:predicted Ser/Thr protein kinase